MSTELEQGQAEDQGGAPKWMVTFGDALTLLLTFFVLLLTYSTPNREDLGMMSRGFVGKGGERGAFQKNAGSSHSVPSRLRQAQPQISRTQFPPIYRQLNSRKLRATMPGLSVSQAAGVEHSVIIRVPLNRLFKTGSKLSRSGRALLRKIAGVMVVLPRVVIVRSRPGRVEGEQDERQKGLKISRRVVERFRSRDAMRDWQFRISPDVQLADEKLKSGHCEIIILHE